MKSHNSKKNIRSTLREGSPKRTEQGQEESRQEKSGKQKPNSKRSSSKRDISTKKTEGKVLSVNQVEDIRNKLLSDDDEEKESVDMDQVRAQLLLTQESTDSEDASAAGATTDPSLLADIRQQLVLDARQEMAATTTNEKLLAMAGARNNQALELEHYVRINALQTAVQSAPAITPECTGTWADKFVLAAQGERTDAHMSSQQLVVPDTNTHQERSESSNMLLGALHNVADAVVHVFDHPNRLLDEEQQSQQYHHSEQTPQGIVASGGTLLDRAAVAETTSSEKLLSYSERVALSYQKNPHVKQER